MKNPNVKLNKWVLAGSITLLLALPLSCGTGLLVTPRGHTEIFMWSLLPGAIAGWIAYKIALADHTLNAAWWPIIGALGWAGGILASVLMLFG